jgi:CopG family nickel-responsive transcriptional regulator
MHAPAHWHLLAKGRINMGNVVRTGLSLDQSLLASFDKTITRKGYQNRSEAIRDLIREHLVREEADENKVVVGTLTLVYDHHQTGLSEKLIETQHLAGRRVLAVTHVHLDHHNCLEVVIMKGKCGDLRRLSDQMLSSRGVKHGGIVITSTGKSLK